MLCTVSPLPCHFVVGNVINLAKAKSAPPAHFCPISLQAKVMGTIKHEHSKQKHLTDAIVCTAVCAAGHVEGSQQLLRTAWGCSTCDDVPEGMKSKPPQKQLPQHIEISSQTKRGMQGV